VHPVTALVVSAAVIGTYVILSAELLATYWSTRMPLPRWVRLQPPRRSRRFMWPNVALAALVIGIGHGLMASLATDGSQPLLTRTIAVVEVVLAAVWSWALVRRTAGGVGRS
jgi:formate hydrogenlyase subunit 3/multisubunit Na+/H+ antiporter MnhD subunit